MWILPRETAGRRMTPPPDRPRRRLPLPNALGPMHRVGPVRPVAFDANIAISARLATTVGLRTGLARTTLRLTRDNPQNGSIALSATFPSALFAGPVVEPVWLTFISCDHWAHRPTTRAHPPLAGSTGPVPRSVQDAACLPGRRMDAEERWRSMRIAVYGAGGVGGYFGWRLARAGVEVHFIARGAHLHAIRE